MRWRLPFPWQRKKDQDIDGSISIVPILPSAGEHSIYNAPPDLEDIQSQWSRVIDRAIRPEDPMFSVLKSRVHTLNLDGSAVSLYLDDANEFTRIQSSSHYQHTITKALCEIFHTTLTFYITDVLRIFVKEPGFSSYPPDIEIPIPPLIKNIVEQDEFEELPAPFYPPDIEIPISPLPIINAVDQIAMELFEQSDSFEIFQVVSILEIIDKQVEVHWFQVREKLQSLQGASEPDLTGYFDVFCISPISTNVTTSISQQTIELARRPLQAGDAQHLLSQEVIERVAPAILAQVLGETPPVSRQFFFLFVPAFPTAGIHVLTFPFDMAVDRATPIPFATSEILSVKDARLREYRLKETTRHWQERYNGYFQTGTVTGIEYYRNDETAAKIAAEINEGQIFGLFGLRRMGKTSLLHEMNRTRRFGDAYVALINLQLYGQNSLWNVLRDALLKWVEDLLAEDKIAEKDKHDLITMREQLEHKNFSQIENTDSFLANIRTLLKVLPDGKRLVLVVDEVAELLPAPPDYKESAFPEWRSFLGFLRTTWEESGHIAGQYGAKPRFVFGVTTYKDDISTNSFHIDGDMNRNPLWTHLPAIPLGPLHREDCERMIQDLGAMAGLYYSPEALEQLYELAYGHPQITRELCHTLTQKIRKEKGIHRIVKKDDVRGVLEEFIRENKTVREMYYGLPPDEKIVTDYLVAYNRISIDELKKNISDIPQNAFNTTLKEIDKTLNDMCNYGLIARDGDTVYLTFGLFRKYLMA